MIIRKKKINKGTEILAETDRLERQKDDLIKEREKRSVNWIRFREKYQNWRLCLYRHRMNGKKLCISGMVRIGNWYWKKELLRELSTFAESYEETSDFAEVRQKIADVWIAKKCGH